MPVKTDGGVRVADVAVAIPHLPDACAHLVVRERPAFDDAARPFETASARPMSHDQEKPNQGQIRRRAKKMAKNPTRLSTAPTLIMSPMRIRPVP
jgi:hypothetical protein